MAGIRRKLLPTLSLMMLALRALSQQPATSFHVLELQKTPAGVSVLAGQNVQALYAPSPVYTRQARNANISGSVVLVGTLGADGCLRDIKIVRSLGYGLDESALEVLHHWRFHPFQGMEAKVEGEMRFDSTLSDRTTPLGKKCGQSVIPFRDTE